jgi:NADPH:quinone reductase
VLELVAPNGAISTYSSMAAPTFEFPFYTVMRLNLTLRFVYLYTIPTAAKQAAVDALRDALDEGRLLHRVGYRTDLEGMVDAYREIERGEVRGSVLVTVDDRA